MTTLANIKEGSIEYRTTTEYRALKDDNDKLLASDDPLTRLVDLHKQERGMQYVMPRIVGRLLDFLDRIEVPSPFALPGESHASIDYDGGVILEIRLVNRSRNYMIARRWAPSDLRRFGDIPSNADDMWAREISMLLVQWRRQCPALVITHPDKGYHL